MPQTTRDSAPERQHHREQAPLQGARCLDAKQGAHNHAEISSRDMDQVALRHVPRAPQPRAARAVRLAGMGEAALAELAAQATECSAALAGNAPTISIEPNLVACRPFPPVVPHIPADRSDQ